MRPSIYSLIPGLSSEVGHLFHYHLSVQRAAQLLGWKYIAFVPKSSFISSTPQEWLPKLVSDPWDVSKNLLQRIQNLLANTPPLLNIFRSFKNDSSAILFLESFELQHLASIFLALFLTKTPKFHFWILHRFVYGKLHFKSLLYRLFHWFLEKKLGKNNIRYLTDSELLALSQKSIFKRAITVVPIPHTYRDVKTAEKISEFYLWWPGGALRKDKGLKVVQNLARLLKPEIPIKLVIAQSGKEFFTPNQQIVFVPTILSREEYQQWMYRAQIILLPYSTKDYSHRTSGIFVEAICAGAIPVTTEGTWMAYELGKFGLSQLTFKWEEEDILERLLQLAEDKEVLKKLQQMRSAYLMYHSEEGFAKTLQSLRATHS